MPFLIAALSILFYAPYIAFRTANNDLISLKNTIKSDDPEAEKIAKSYFNHRVNPQRTMYLRIAFNVLIKILYLVANLVAFLGLDNLLNNEYISYGKKWVDWSKLNNSMAFDYLGMRDFPKPGELYSGWVCYDDAQVYQTKHFFSQSLCKWFFQNESLVIKYIVLYLA